MVKFGNSKKILLWLRRNKGKSTLALSVLVLYYFSLPSILFDTPYTTVLESKQGDLLGAKIAKDGQWRFPQQDSLSEKFKQCIVYYEDQYFYQHPGFNPIAIFNALLQNNKANRVIRGGSTITQQVIRLSRQHRKRTYLEKLIELVLATRLEWRHSKDEILRIYAAHAPFGGNVVGLEMASWRYFGVEPSQLSWAETATLAVLPNAPSLIYPGKNQQLLLQKRNRLLQRLFEKGVIDSMTYTLALEEALPQRPYDLPQIAPHLLDRISVNDEGKRIQSTLKIELQQRVNQLAEQYYRHYRQNEVYNLAVMVVDVKTREVLAYIGNAPTDKSHQKDVDIIQAPRSTGSILKPLLYAGMLNDGKILPNTLVADVPTQISGYTPENFDHTYDGAVPAHLALARSLNIPCVLMLQQYGIYKFYEELHKFNIRHINRHPDSYGLSLILGGAEASLWDLCKTYANLSSTLNYYNANGFYREREFSDLNVYGQKQADLGKDIEQENILGAGSIWLTYQAMKEVNRPRGDEAWKFYDSALEIAWKTGTSFGNRDAWAIGTTKDYVVGVWVGNATGEGRPTLTGVSNAAPILFDVFRLLPRSGWFDMPLNDIEDAEICTLSGSLAGEYCNAENAYIPVKGLRSNICPYHSLVHLDKEERFRVNSSCVPVDEMVTKSWFVLPPVMEWYYKSKHADYKVLPPYRADCTIGQGLNMDFIYPKEYSSKIYLTRDFDGLIQPVILKVAHNQARMKLFWYMDGVFLGTTQNFHEMAVNAQSGTYLITVTDEYGGEIRRRVTIVNE
ncbi:penicillin-binding protein 1C [Olivibacter sitiensis]|uniref:penicillin-binding protein 1C n=1 Tax=Olivibacter sitiensis TaxID=376470 RepID=UPI0004195EB1|nr:penicillin-binding protein 1C [Olivibacter sitiensis]